MCLHGHEDVRKARAARRQRVPILAHVLLAELGAWEERAEGGRQRRGVELADLVRVRVRFRVRVRVSGQGQG